MSVSLTNDAGTPVLSTVTANGGLYGFSSLLGAGLSYRINVAGVSGGLVSTLALQGSDPARDSDMDPLTHCSAPFGVASQTTLEHLDAGFAPPAVVSGSIFDDIDGDGERDIGEPTLPGWSIFSDTNGNQSYDAGEPRTATAADGKYTFWALGPSLQSICVVPLPHWTIVTPPSALVIDPRPGQQISIAIAAHTEAVDVASRCQWMCCGLAPMDRNSGIQSMFKCPPAP